MKKKQIFLILLMFNFSSSLFALKIKNETKDETITGFVIEGTEKEGDSLNLEKLEYFETYEGPKKHKFTLKPGAEATFEGNFISQSWSSKLDSQKSAIPTGTKEIIFKGNGGVYETHVK